jgi:hypothetical protein
LQGLVEILDEQAVFGFTGRINIILKSNRQYVGMVAQKEGVIVDAAFRSLQGRKALFAALIEDISAADLAFVVEPEVIEDSEVSLSLSVAKLKKEFSSRYEEFLAAQKLRPPNELRLVINSEFISSGASIGNDEFTLLCTLTEYNRVGDLYEHTPMLDYEITGALVTLRKKGALRVFKNQ